MKICGKRHIGMVFVDDPKILRGPLYRNSKIPQFPGWATTQTCARFLSEPKSEKEAGPRDALCNEHPGNRTTCNRSGTYDARFH